MELKGFTICGGAEQASLNPAIYMQGGKKSSQINL